MENSGAVSYSLFVAGCIDLVDDKLDHMLWKIFTMVDEDHSGEISTVELEHFLRTACDGHPSPAGTGGPRLGDVERYLRSVLDPEATAGDIIARIAGDRRVISFEELKWFVLDGAGYSAASTETEFDGTGSPVSAVRRFDGSSVDRYSDRGTPCSAVRVDSVYNATPCSALRVDRGMASMDGAAAVEASIAHCGSQNG